MTPDEQLHSWEAEATVLGALMLTDAPKVLRWGASVFNPDWFYEPAHNQIAQVIQSLMREGRGAGLVEVRQRLGTNIVKVGGAEYLIQLSEYAIPASFGRSIRTVTDLWQRRTLVARANALASTAGDLALPMREILKSANNIPRGVRTGGDMIITSSDVVMDETVSDGIPTGMACIDKLLVCRGFPKAHVTVILGPRGNGKTYLQVQHCAGLVDEFRRVCFVTLEMTPSELLTRMVQQETGCYRRPQDEFRRGLYDEAVTRFRGLPLTFIHPKAHGDTDIESICAAVRAEHDVDPFDCIYLDYFQLLTSVRGADMRHNEVQILSLAARELKQLAVECNCPVVVASQNHDQMNANKAVDLMVKGARSLEEVAALIIGIIKKDGAEVDVAVSKNRFGRSRVENLPIGWDVARCRFTEG